MAVGDRVDLGFAKVEVEAMGEHGPTALALRFDRALEEASVLLLTWSGEAVAEVPLPTPGEAVPVPWSRSHCPVAY